MADRHKTPQEESRYHHYVGNRIPWFVHLGWVLFWVFAISYTLTYVFPALKLELVTPP